MTLGELCDSLKDFCSIEFFILLSLSSTIFLILLVTYLIYLHKKYKEAINGISTNRCIMETLAKENEIILFDEDNKVIYTTNPGKYSSKTEFTDYLSKKVSLTMDFKTFCTALNNNDQFRTVLKCTNNFSRTDQQYVDQKYIAQQRFSISNYISELNNNQIITTVISDITEYYTKVDELMRSYKKLETFIDNLPLGIFYMGKDGKILGCNITFASYLKISREKIIGSAVQDYIDNFELGKIYNEPIKVTLKSRYFTGIQVFLIKPPLISFSSLQPLIVLKTSEVLNESQSEAPKIPASNIETSDTFKCSTIPALVINKQGNIHKCNKSFLKLIKQDKLPIDNIFSVLNQSAEGKPTKEEFIKAIIDPYTYTPMELQINISNYTKIVQIYVSQIVTSLTNKNSLLLQMVDVSAQKVMEQQFLQSQKIQAIGQLASGIAHDFNNLLTAMIGFCDLLLQRYVPSDPSYDDVVQIKQNAGRAASLVKQLLAFSRQQTLKPQIIILTDTLLELSPLLKRLMGPNIDFRLNPGQDIWAVKVDNGQFEQIVMNLVVNARDAMQNNGILVVQLRNFYSDQAFQCIDAVAPKGDYVLLEVIDNGCGMDSETMKHIFEPFYSRKNKVIRKSTGSGTGLGLATVYGIVNQTGGYIKVESQINKGTVFKVFLPRYQGTETTSGIHKATQFSDLSGTETILLVEDETAVRQFAARALKDKGYKIIEAANGVEALQVAQGKKIDMLITDVIMPKIDGPTLNKKLRENNKNFKTIFISGYTEDTFRQDLDRDFGIHFMQKPFTLKDLANKVREVFSN